MPSNCSTFILYTNEVMTLFNCMFGINTNVLKVTGLIYICICLLIFSNLFMKIIRLNLYIYI